MFNQAIASLFHERDQVAADLAKYDSDIKKASSFAREELKKRRSEAANAQKAIDETLPVLLAAAGRVSEARLLFPDASLVGALADVVAMTRGRFEAVTQAAVPFDHVYFGGGNDGQTFLGLKDLGFGIWLSASEQTRHRDTAVFVGPEAMVKRLCFRHRLHALQFPDGLPRTHRHYLLRIHGPTDSPLYNPHYLARNVPSYVVTVGGQVVDGFIKMRTDGHDDFTIRAVVAPQVFADEWWTAASPPPAFPWQDALLDVGSWEATTDHP